MGSLYARFLAVLYVLAILPFQNVNPVDNWNVSYREEGKIKWAKYCDWEGNNFDEIQDVPIGDNCGNICLADPKCTHFSWVDETCFLKEITTPVIETPFQEVDTCGFIVHRRYIDKTSVLPSSSNTHSKIATTTVAKSTKTSLPTTESTIQTTSTTPSSTTKRPMPTTKLRRIYTPFDYPEPKPTTPIPKHIKVLNVPYEDRRIKWDTGRISEKTTYMKTNFLRKTFQAPQECGIQGTLIVTMNTPFLQDCVEACLSRTDCNEFTWNKETTGTYCNLGRKILIGDDFNYLRSSFSYIPDKEIIGSCIGGSVITRHRQVQNVVSTSPALTAPTTVTTQSTTRTTTPSSTTQTPSTSTVSRIRKSTAERRHKYTQFSYPESKFKPTPFSESFKSLNVPYEDGRIKWTPGKTCDSQENVATSNAGTVIRDFSNELLRGCVERCLITTGCTQFTWKAINSLCLLKNDVISFGEKSFSQNSYYSNPDEYCISGSVVMNNRHQDTSSIPVTTTTTEKITSIVSLSQSDKFTSTRSLDTSFKSSEIKWASNCDFTTEEECGKLCMAGTQCTHFVWIKGICFLNAESKLVSITKTNYQEEPRCGYVANRYEIFGDSQATSEPILIKSKDGRVTSTVTTIAPTTPSTPISTFSVPKTTIDTTQSIFDTQWMRDRGIVRTDDCEHISRYLLGSTNSNTKVDCAQTCLNSATCAYFTWNLRSCSLFPYDGVIRSTIKIGSMCGSIRNRELPPSTSTTTTPVPTPPSTSTSTTSKTTFSTTTQPVIITWQWMRVNGGWIHWSNNCKYISPIGLAVTLRNSKEDCAESCVESATCVSFQFKHANGVCQLIKANNWMSASTDNTGYVCGAVTRDSTSTSTSHWQMKTTRHVRKSTGTLVLLK